MGDKKFQFDPDSANADNADNGKTPYAKRSLNSIAVFVIALLLVGAFVGWYFLVPDGNSNDPDTVANYEQEPRQLPGNSYKKGSGRSDLYNFFYTMFGGIEDGLEDNPHNLNNVENLDQFNLDNTQGLDVDGALASKQERQQQLQQIAQAQNPYQDDYRHSVFDIVGSDVFGRKGDRAGRIYDILVHKESGKAKVVVVNDDDQRYQRDLSAVRFKRVLKQQSEGNISLTISEEKVENKPDFSYTDLENTQYISLRHLRDGQLLDFEGEVAGQIDAIIYENAEVQNIYFTLRPQLAGRGPDTFRLPFSETEIIESPDGYDIQLTKEQTVALAETLFNVKSQ